MNPVDYKKMLKVYLGVVIDSESIDFLHHYRADLFLKNLSVDELIELRRMSKEVQDEASESN
jgi:hypothetical protein